MKPIYLFDNNGNNIQVSHNNNLITVNIDQVKRTFTVKQFKQEIKELNEYIERWLPDESK